MQVVLSSSHRAKRGFTLIEIMIAILIMGILLGMAVPNFLKARETTRTKSCIENLKKIQWAKDQWAIENQKNNTDTPTNSDLSGSFKYLVDLPSCPSGGVYTLGNVGTTPVCSLSTQAAPQQHQIP